MNDTTQQLSEKRFNPMTFFEFLLENRSTWGFRAYNLHISGGQREKTRNIHMLINPPTIHSVCFVYHPHFERDNVSSIECVCRILKGISIVWLQNPPTTAHNLALKNFKQ